MTELLSFKKESLVARQILYDWWQRLDDNRGDRAKLRRCQSPTEIIFQPAFHQLRQKLETAEYKVNPELAHVAGLLSHVKNHSDNKNFAQQIAATKQDSTQTVLSGLRFRRLLAINNRDDLFLQLLRVIRLLDSQANIYSLANDVYYWNDSTRKQWAYAYYEAAPKAD